jgi:hypothetical protein
MICVRVLTYDGSEQVSDKLKQELAGQNFDGSYASAATCLLQMMDTRINGREKLDQLRRDRN